MAPRRPRDIGTVAEAAVVRYLRTAGFPHAERRALRGNQDAGDITGTPGLCWSVKAGAYAREPSDGRIEEWLDELETQRINAEAAWGVLITRRHRAADPSDWWAWLPCDALILLGGGPREPWPDMPDGAVCLHLATVCAVLRGAGYGDKLARRSRS